MTQPNTSNQHHSPHRLVHRIRQGCAAHLNHIEQETSHLLARQKRAIRLKSKKERLISKVRSLRSKLTEARASSYIVGKSQTYQNLLDRLLKKSTPTAKLVPPIIPSHNTLKLNQDVRSNLSFRLAGLSVCRLPRGVGICSDEHVVLRIDAALRKRSDSHFFVILQYQTDPDLETSRLHVIKHTLPFFVPLERLQRLYLNSDVSEFAWRLASYCRAFVSRREQLELLKIEMDKCDVVITSTPAIDLIAFILRSHHTGYKSDVHIHLAYEELMHSLPSRALVRAMRPLHSSTDSASSLRLRSIEHAFMQQCAPLVLHDLMQLVMQRTTR